MNGKERLLAAIAMEETDRTPFLPPFQGYWALGLAGMSVQESIDKPQEAAKAQMAVIDRCGFDGFESMWDWLSMVEALGCKVKIPETGTIPTIEPVIKSPADLDRISIPDPNRDYRFLSSVRSTEYLRSQVQDEKLLTMVVVSPFTLVGEMRGVEELMMETFTETAFVKEMLRLANETVSEYCKAILETEADMIALCEPTASGSLISPEGFNEFSAPYMKSCSDRIRNEGWISMIHICGDTNDRLKDIAMIGADIFSMDAMVDVSLASQQVNHAIMGNIDPTQILYSGTPSSVRQEVFSIVSKARTKGFILGAGCDIAPGTPLENVEAVSRSIC